MVAAGSIWGGAAFERIAAGASASHDALVKALQLGPGARMLDVATGTGPLAVRAAEHGAVVTGVDIAPALLERARSAAAKAGLSIEFRAGDAQRLPFEASSFDVVASAQGAVFATDREAVARELARVCRPGGALGLTCPIASGFPFELARILASFRAGDAWLGPFAWGEPEEVRRLLGRDFELDFEEIAAPFCVSTPREGWHVYRESFGPLAALVESLGPVGSAELQARVIELLRGYVTPDGVVAPRPLLLVIGRRRGVQQGPAAGAPPGPLWCCCAVPAPVWMQYETVSARTSVTPKPARFVSAYVPLRAWVCSSAAAACWKFAVAAAAIPLLCADFAAWLVGPAAREPAPKR